MPAALSQSAFGRIPLPPAVRRALSPHAAALVALVLFLAAGLAVLDDYGVALDENLHRNVWAQTLRYIQGDRGALPSDHHKFYGTAFQAPLSLVERAFGLEDGRGVYLFRHLFTHLFYLSGGIFAYLLARGLFGARPLALIAMLLFLLHPRLYAHSFINGQDSPFFVMFAVALFLARHAFRRNTLGAFIALGFAVGALINLRIMGVILFAAAPAARTLDFAFARDWAERKRILLTTGAFALACVLTVYALLPYLWADPVRRAVEWAATLSDHPFIWPQLFRGTVYLSTDVPPDYIPVWFSISTPPFALLAGLAGAAAILISGFGSPARALRNTRLRFALLLVGCFALPVLAVMLLDSTLYGAWRHMHFLWAPFSLIATFGLRRLLFAFRRARLRAAVYGAAGAGLAATLISMAILHPNEQAYFNASVDRVTPEKLRSQYVVEYWLHPFRQTFERLLEQSPSSPIKANTAGLSGMAGINLQMLPEAARGRISTAPDADAVTLDYRPPLDEARLVDALKVYDNTILVVTRKADLRAAYAAAKSGEPIIRAGFDIHYIDGALVYVKEPCDQAEATSSRFELWIVPEYDAAPPGEWTLFGYEDRSFHFPGHGAFFDGACVASVPLPHYAATVRARQLILDDAANDGNDTLLWEADAVLDSEPWRAALRAVAAVEPLARAAFDLRLNDGALVYAKQPCEQADTEARFFLHVVPERPSDLPSERRTEGFDSLDFEFFMRGAHFDGNCMACVPLPDYPIASIRTGQFVNGEGEIWSVNIPIGKSSDRGR